MVRTVIDSHTLTASSNQEYWLSLPRIPLSTSIVNSCRASIAHSFFPLNCFGHINHIHILFFRLDTGFPVAIFLIKATIPSSCKDGAPNPIVWQLRTVLLQVSNLLNQFPGLDNRAESPLFPANTLSAHRWSGYG